MCTMYVLMATVSAEIALLSWSLAASMCYYHLDFEQINDRSIDRLTVTWFRYYAHRITCKTISSELLRIVTCTFNYFHYKHD